MSFLTAKIEESREGNIETGSREQSERAVSKCVKCGKDKEDEQFYTEKS